jgi:hypothetical protein
MTIIINILISNLDVQMFPFGRFSLRASSLALFHWHHHWDLFTSTSFQFPSLTHTPNNWKRQRWRLLRANHLDQSLYSQVLKDSQRCRTILYLLIANHLDQSLWSFTRKQQGATVTIVSKNSSPIVRGVLENMHSSQVATYLFPCWAV